ncbi:hypothetical protein L209DRAFT_367932 [Thermothelomyces heterothallicus CBS 203.75]
MLGIGSGKGKVNGGNCTSPVVFHLNICLIAHNMIPRSIKQHTHHASSFVLYFFFFFFCRSCLSFLYGYVHTSFSFPCRLDPYFAFPLITHGRDRLSLESH